MKQQVGMRRWAQGLWRGANHHLKRQATAEYRAALGAGLLTPGPCEVCGSTRRIHGHHEDYGRPLDVIWLCPLHHAGRHNYHQSIEEMRDELV